MNEYYVKFKNGGFAYVYADGMHNENKEVVFTKEDEVTRKEVEVARYPLDNIQSIEENPTFGA